MVLDGRGVVFMVNSIAGVLWFCEFTVPIRQCSFLVYGFARTRCLFITSDSTTVTGLFLASVYVIHDLELDYVSSNSEISTENLNPLMCLCTKQNSFVACSM